VSNSAPVTPGVEPDVTAETELLVEVVEIGAKLLHEG